MSEQRRWFSFYPQDYLGDLDIIDWPLEAHGLYIKLLSLQWIHGRLPGDLRQLSRISGVDVRQLRRIYETYLKEKFDSYGGTICNPRLERERQLADDKRLTLSEAGRKGGAKSKPPLKPKRSHPEAREKEKEKEKESTLCPAKPNTEHAQAVRYFCDSYESNIGQKYLFQAAKDGALVKRLLSAFQLEGFKKLTDELFKARDPFILDKGRTIGVMSAFANQLMQGALNTTTELDRYRELERKAVAGELD